MVCRLGLPYFRGFDELASIIRTHQYQIVEISFLGEAPRKVSNASQSLKVNK